MVVEAICESEREDNPSQSMFPCKVSFSVQNYYCITSEETEAQMS